MQSEELARLPADCVIFAHGKSAELTVLYRQRMEANDPLPLQLLVQEAATDCPSRNRVRFACRLSFEEPSFQTNHPVHASPR